MFPMPIDRASRRVNVAYRAALPIVLIIWLLPLIAVMLTATRSLGDITNGNYWGIPTEFALFDNLSTVFLTTPMTRYIFNSVVITLPTVAGTITISAMAGFALAKYGFRGNLLLFAMFIAGNFIPFQILMIPVRQLMVDLGMFDSYFSLIVFHIAFQSGFATLFLRNFIKALPHELFEAARVDGANEFEIFVKIVLPLLKPALAALSVLIFTFIWNDYFWALVLVQSDDVRPVTIGLAALRGQWVASWNLISAGSLVAAVPPVIMFFAMQKHFIQGLTLGATKG